MRIGGDELRRHRGDERIEERGAGADGDERVHVGGKVPGAHPRGAVELPAGPEEHGCRERELHVIDAREVQVCHADDDDGQRQQRAGDELPPERTVLGGVRGGFGVLQDAFIEGTGDRGPRTGTGDLGPGISCGPACGDGGAPGLRSVGLLRTLASAGEIINGDGSVTELIPGPRSPVPKLDDVIPHIPDRFDNGRDVEDRWIEGDRGAIRGVVDVRGGHALSAVERALDVGGACGAGHAGDGEGDRTGIGDRGPGTSYGGTMLISAVVRRVGGHIKIVPLAALSFRNPSPGDTHRGREMGTGDIHNRPPVPGPRSLSLVPPPVRRYHRSRFPLYERAAGPSSGGARIPRGGRHAQIDDSGASDRRRGDRVRLRARTGAVLEAHRGHPRLRLRHGPTVVGGHLGHRQRHLRPAGRCAARGRLVPPDRAQAPGRDPGGAEFLEQRPCGSIRGDDGAGRQGPGREVHRRRLDHEVRSRKEERRHRRRRVRRRKVRDRPGRHREGQGPGGDYRPHHRHDDGRDHGERQG